MRLAASYHSPDWNNAACAAARRAMTSTAGEKDDAEYTERMRKESKCCGEK